MRIIEGGDLTFWEGGYEQLWDKTRRFPRNTSRNSELCPSRQNNSNIKNSVVCTSGWIAIRLKLRPLLIPGEEQAVSTHWAGMIWWESMQGRADICVDYKIGASKFKPAHASSNFNFFFWQLKRTSDHVALNDKLCVITCHRCGVKQLRPNYKYYSDMCLELLRKTRKTPPVITACVWI
jgi:hypothetical protein